MKSNTPTTASDLTASNQSFGSPMIWLALSIMVLVGVLSRLEFVAVPNVKPIAALCLLSAFYLRGSWLPYVALLVVMLISDWQLGAYAWPVMLGVYASLGLSCVLGNLVRRGVDRSSLGRVKILNSGPRLVVASLIMSTSFFVLTNGMVWLAGGLYPPTFQGVLSCYGAGIPFYRFTLLGDLIFTTGGLVAWQLMGSLVRPSVVADRTACSSV